MHIYLYISETENYSLTIMRESTENGQKSEIDKDQILRNAKMRCKFSQIFKNSKISSTKLTTWPHGEIKASQEER